MTTLKGNINSNNKFIRILLYVVLLSIILYTGRQLFIPVSFALLISFILYPVCKWMERHGINKPTAIILGVSFVVILFLFMVVLLIWQFRSFLSEWPLLQEKLMAAVADIRQLLVQRLGFSEDQVGSWGKDMLKGSGGTIQAIGSSLGNLFVNLFMIFIIPVFAFLILLYRTRLISVLYGLFPPARSAKIEEVVRLSIHTYYNFIKGMLVVYAVVGILNSIGLLLLGVPHAILFGFLTAIMTFIPYVGIIVASLLPITYAWITYNSIWYPLGVIGVFAFVQYLEANIIFPWAVGHRLQLNTLVTLVVIIAGGILWGASGMILFVPFAAILKLVADRMEGWELLSKILGDDRPPAKRKMVIRPAH